MVDLYYRNSTTGLSIVPKLKYEHVFLTSFSKMRVDLAAQVSQCAFFLQWYAFTTFTLGIKYISS